MESIGFIQQLLQSLSRARGKAKRRILRVASAAEYRRAIAAIRGAKKSGLRLPAVRALPLIRAFSFRGSLDSAFLRKYAGLLSVEEDIPLTVHAIPSTAPDRHRRPFVPSGIRTVRAPEVWRRSLGDRIRIGVIDTGADFDHPDLRSSLAYGINLVHPRLPPYDDNGHGTHICGTIAAAGRHAMTGIAPRAILLPVKAFDHQGSAYVSDIIKAIDWCVQQGVHIINMSFGMKQRSESMLEAVHSARRAGIVIIASAGNDGRRGFIDYPARFPQTISVGALDARGSVAPFSNRGRRIDVYAPGEKIVSTWPRGRYHEMNGTSMATAHVTGVLALAMAARPGLKPMQVRRLIGAAQIPLKARRKTDRKTRGPGRIDAVRAFRHLKL